MAKWKSINQSINASNKSKKSVHCQLKKETVQTDQVNNNKEEEDTSGPTVVMI